MLPCNRKANAACGEGESDYGLIVSISVPAAIMIETIDPEKHTDWKEYGISPQSPS
jgi:hypothetical protein